MHAGSAYRVARRSPQPDHRLDPSVTEAVEQAIPTADSAAAAFLCDAWRQLYGLHLDPDAGSGDAVRAVERLAARVDGTGGAGVRTVVPDPHRGPLVDQQRCPS